MEHPAQLAGIDQLRLDSRQGFARKGGAMGAGQGEILPHHGLGVRRANGPLSPSLVFRQTGTSQGEGTGGGERQQDTAGREHENLYIW